MLERSFETRGRLRGGRTLRLLEGALLALGIAWAAGAAGPVYAQEAREILEETAETYRNLQQYQLAGTISVLMEVPGSRQAIDLDLQMAEHRPGRLHLEIDRPNQEEVVIISSGDSTWMYVPALNQYMGRAGAYALGSPESPISDLLGDYQKLADRVENVALLREEDVDVGGRPYPSYVLEVAYTPRATAAGADSSRKTLWIDKDRHVVLREEARTRMADSPFGGPVIIHETTAFSTVRIGEPLPDSLFAFTPPPGATRIYPEEVMGAGEGGLQGTTAENFTLTNLAGEEVSLEELRGQVVLLNFWATWCGPCRIEMPALEQLYQEFAEEGLVVLAIDLAETASEVRQYIEGQGFTFPVLLDYDTRVAEQYGASEAVPTTFIIDREGKITHHFMGARPEPVFRAALKELGFE